MSLEYPLDMPSMKVELSPLGDVLANYEPLEIRMRLHNNQLTARSITGTQSVIQRPSSWWSGNILLPKIRDRNKAREWIAFLIGLRGKAGTFKLTHNSWRSQLGAHDISIITALPPLEGFDRVLGLSGIPGKWAEYTIARDNLGGGSYRLYYHLGSDNPANAGKKDDGGLTFSDPEINSIIWTGGGTNQLQFTRETRVGSDNTDLQAYFQAGGGGENHKLYIFTQDGNDVITTEIPHSNFNDGGSAAARLVWDVPAAQRSILNDMAAGDKVIFAFSEDLPPINDGLIRRVAPEIKNADTVEFLRVDENVLNVGHYFRLNGRMRMVLRHEDTYEVSSALFADGIEKTEITFAPEVEIGEIGEAEELSIELEDLYIVARLLDDGAWSEDQLDRTEIEINWEESLG